MTKHTNELKNTFEKEKSEIIARLKMEGKQSLKSAVEGAQQEMKATLLQDIKVIKELHAKEIASLNVNFAPHKLGMSGLFKIICQCSGVKTMGKLRISINGKNVIIKSMPLFLKFRLE